MSKFTLVNSPQSVEILLPLANLLLVALAVILVFSHQELPPLLPLWFSKTWGLERLAAPANLWLIPTLGFSFFLVNQVCAQIIKSKRPVLAKILIWTSLIISAILLLSVYRVILITI